MRPLRERENDIRAFVADAIRPYRRRLLLLFLLFLLCIIVGTLALLFATNAIPLPVGDVTLDGDVIGLASDNVVVNVGGSSAALVHSGEVLANDGTPFDIPNTLVKRDYRGDFAATEINATTFSATGATTATTAFEASVLGDTYQRFAMTASGAMLWGSGAGVETNPTANLYRAAPGVMQTDGALTIIPTITTALPQLPSTWMAPLQSIPAWNLTSGAGLNVAAAYFGINMTATLAGTTGIIAVVINDGGTGYGVGNFLSIPGGTTSCELQVTSVGNNGAIASLIITRGGAGYTAGNGIAVSGGGGSNATVNTTVSSTNFAHIDGLVVEAILPNTGYSTAAASFVEGIRIRAPNLGNGPISVGNSRAITIADQGTASSFASIITTGALVGGTTSNIQIVLGVTVGAATATTGGIAIGTVSGGLSNTGLSVSASSGGPTNIGISIAEPGAGSTRSAALWLAGASGLSNGGILWGSDTGPISNLYRVAGGTLRTDGAFQGLPRWNQTTGTTALGVGVLGSNSLGSNGLSGLQLSTNGISTFVVANGGTGYAVNNLLTVTGGSGTAQVKVTSVLSGAILTVVLTRPGFGYSVANGVALTGGSGTATLNITAINTTPFTTVVGVQGQGFDATGGFATPTVTTAIGFQTVAPVLGSGPVVVTNIVGIDVPTHAVTTTNSYGLRIAAPTGGATINNALNFVADTIAAGGITFGADATPSTNLYRSAVNIITTDADHNARHYYTKSAAIPTAVAGTGAGTGPTITVAAGSTDCKMQITVLTGSAPTAAGIIMTVTYNSAFINTLNKGVIFSPANANAAALSGATNPYVPTEALGSFVFNAGSSALAATTSYIWNFQACV